MENYTRDLEMLVLMLCSNLQGKDIFPDWQTTNNDLIKVISSLSPEAGFNLKNIADTLKEKYNK